jgi:chromosome segregation ATPase
MKMRSIDEIQREIKEVAKKIESATTEREKLKVQAEKLKQSNRELLSSCIGGDQKPECLKIQRRELFETQETRAELKDVIGYLGDRAADLEKELQLTQVFGDVANYKKQDKKFFRAIDRVRDAGGKLDSVISDLEKAVGELHEIGDPQRTLRAVLLKIKGKAAYDRFLEGELCDADPIADNRYINEKKIEYESIQQLLPQIKELDDIEAGIDTIITTVCPVGFGSVLKSLFY